MFISGRTLRSMLWAPSWMCQNVCTLCCLQPTITHLFEHLYPLHNTLQVLLCQLLRAFRFEPTGDPLFDSMDTISRLTSRPKQPVVRAIAIKQ